MQQIFEQLRQRATRLYDDILAGRLADWRTYVFAYIVSATVLILAFVTRDSLDPVTGARLIFALSIPAVLISAAAGGWGPGLFATGQTAAAAYIFMPAKASLTTQILLILLHAAICVLIVWGGEQLRHARRRSFAAEDELSARDSQIRAILAACPDATLVTDHRGRVVAFNPAAERQFGHPAAQMLGKAVTTVVPGFDVRKPVATGNGRHADGTGFPVSLATGTFQAGDKTYVTVFVRNVSVSEGSTTATEAV